MYQTLLFVHVTCFAVWMGAVVASLLVVRSLEERLTSVGAPADVDLLRAYIRREIKLVDVAFAGVLISGLMLAGLFHGWTSWVFLKLGLFIAQFVATLGYIRLFIRGITYPCPPARYRRWYGLFAVSIGFFATTLLVVYFGR